MATPAETVVRLKTPACLWRLDCRGSFALWDGDGRLVTIRGRKARAILAYLVTNPHEHVTRERLIQLLWPDRGMAQARGSLRQSLVEIRRAAPGVIASDHEHVWIDTSRLGPVEIADNCSPTEQLFDDLDGITPEFDDWLRCERATEASEKWSRLQQSVEDRLKRGRGASALPLIERMQRIDPYNEEWLRLAMRADAQAGHSAGIQTRFRELDELLKRELGVPLSPQTRELHDELLRDLTRPTAGVDFEVEETIEARTRNQPANKVAAPRSVFRLPSLLIAGLAALAATLGISQSVRPAPAQQNRIAVLPFTALDGVDSALAEGMADEVLSDLSQHNGLQTVGRTSAWMFKDKAADLRQVGRRLDVRYVVEGSVRRTGNVVRLNIALVDTRDASTLWSRGFQSAAGDIQKIEDAATAGIVQRLGHRTGKSDQHADPQAYALYLRAKGLMRNRNLDDSPKAIELLREAVRMDPNFAAAWAQLALASHLALKKDVVIDLNGREFRISKREAAKRALRLNPNLAEGHATLAMLDRTKASGRAHLRRALELAPGDTQTLYWWGAAIAGSGDYKRSGEIMRQTAALDPLWKRPVQEAVTSSLVAGDRSRALRYLRGIKEGNPAAAVEVEVQMSYNDADFSRVVQLELSDPTLPWDAGKARAIRTLASLGYIREAMLLFGAGPFARSVLSGHAPALQIILQRIRNDAEEGDDLPIYSAVSWELARERRWNDLAAIYDAGFGLMQDVKGDDPGGRYFRQVFAPIYVIALKRAGRDRDAIRLALLADEGAKFTLAKGEVQPEPLVSIAGLNAVLGRREDALKHLEDAFSKNWRLDEFIIFRLGDRAEFATLRGNPRFERLRRIQNAHIAKERREIAALGII